MLFQFYPDLHQLGIGVIASPSARKKSQEVPPQLTHNLAEFLKNVSVMSYC